MLFLSIWLGGCRHPFFHSPFLDSCVKLFALDGGDFLEPNRRMKTAKSTVLAVLLVMTFNFARAEWRFEAETGWFYDSNLSNSDRASDEENDWAWNTNLRLGNGLQLSRDLRLNIATDWRGHLWDQYGAFNEIGAGASVGDPDKRPFAPPSSTTIPRRVWHDQGIFDGQPPPCSRHWPRFSHPRAAKRF
jgi:hypothetical protein